LERKKKKQAAAAAAGHAMPNKLRMQRK